MEEMKKSITFMQNNLNQLLDSEEQIGCGAPRVYTLSVMLDKEIVKYYRNLSQTTC